MRGEESASSFNTIRRTRADKIYPPCGLRRRGSARRSDAPRWQHEQHGHALNPLGSRCYDRAMVVRRRSIVVGRRSPSTDLSLEDCLARDAWVGSGRYACIGARVCSGLDRHARRIRQCVRSCAVVRYAPWLNGSDHSSQPNPLSRIGDASRFWAVSAEKCGPFRASLADVERSRSGHLTNAEADKGSLLNCCGFAATLI